MTPTTPTRRFLSIIVPVPNESATAEEIYKSVRTQTAQLPVDWELIFVHDNRCEETFLVSQLVKLDSEHVQALEVEDTRDRSTALARGYRAAQGDLVFTLESDLQDRASELTSFLDRINWSSEPATTHLERNEPIGWWQNILPRGVLRAA